MRYLNSAGGAIGSACFLSSGYIKTAIAEAVTFRQCLGEFLAELVNFGLSK